MGNHWLETLVNGAGLATVALILLFLLRRAHHPRALAQFALFFAKGVPRFICKLPVEEVPHKPPQVRLRRPESNCIGQPPAGENGILLVAAYHCTEWQQSLYPASGDGRRLVPPNSTPPPYRTMPGYWRRLRVCDGH